MYSVPRTCYYSHPRMHYSCKVKILLLPTYVEQCAHAIRAHFYVTERCSSLRAWGRDCPSPAKKGRTPEMGEYFAMVVETKKGMAVSYSRWAFASRDREIIQISVSPHHDEYAAGGRGAFLLIINPFLLSAQGQLQASSRPAPGQAAQGSQQNHVSCRN
jgi:hypothetical protein